MLRNIRSRQPVINNITERSINQRQSLRVNDSSMNPSHVLHNLQQAQKCCSTSRSRSGSDQRILKHRCHQPVLSGLPSMQASTSPAIELRAASLARLEESNYQINSITTILPWLSCTGFLFFFLNVIFQFLADVVSQPDDT